MPLLFSSYTGRGRDHESVGAVNPGVNQGVLQAGLRDRDQHLLAVAVGALRLRDHPVQDIHVLPREGKIKNQPTIEADLLIRESGVHDHTRDPALHQEVEGDP